MSIASELNALNGYILGAYNEINTMGGTIPANQNMANLASAISTIPSGGGPTDNNWAEVMRGESTTLYDNAITTLIGYQMSLYNASGSNITSISFPLLTSMGTQQFRNRTTLASVNLPLLEKLSAGSEFYNTGITSIKLAGLKSSSSYDMKNNFQNCASLVKADLGSYANANDCRFHTAVFGTCSSLTTLILRFPSVPSMYNVAANNFGSTPLISGTGFVYVPKSLIDSYKNGGSTKWGAFSTQYRAIEDYSSDGTVDGEIN